jgi:hypothetical protein
MGRTWNECSKTGYQEECLDLSRKKEEEKRKNCIMESIIGVIEDRRGM